jgi:hypothetical protein
VLPSSITDDGRESQHFSTKKLDHRWYFRSEMFDLVDFARWAGHHMAMQTSGRVPRDPTSLAG